MPSVENWTSNPLQTINNIFENRRNDSDWIKDVETYFGEKIKDFSSLTMIPSINDTPLHDLPSGCLVRFRCMIQETFDPEYSLAICEIAHKVTGEKILRSAVFQDHIECEDEFDVMESSPRSVTGCSQVLYCVAIPAETSWVKAKYNERNCAYKDPSLVSSGSGKRRLEEDMETEGSHEANHTVHSSKRQRPTAVSHNERGRNDERVQRSSLQKNHPLPDEDGPVCIVKVHDENKEFKVNEVYEFVGVLSNDPSLSAAYDAVPDEHVNGNLFDDAHMEEHRAHHPPASFAPRLHCVTMVKLEHNNPLLHFNKSFTASIARSQLRSEVVSFLKQATFGDELAAEYLLMHLCARVHTRTGSLAVGKLSLNISNISPTSKYPQLLANLLEDVVTKAFFLPMTLENLKRLKLVPTKNYTTNRLDAGVLQLSDGTHLVLGETSLMPGQLDDNGVKNINALTSLLKFQKVDYNFHYHTLTFHHDIPVLVLSEGKSLLPCDIQIPLQNETAMPDDLEMHFNSIKSQVDLVEKIRCYLTLTHLSDYKFNKNMMQVIENDFVVARQQGNEKMTADDLHLHLVIARLLSIGFGSDCLTVDLWRKACYFEAERKRRL